MSLTKATYSLIEGAPINILDFGAVGNGVANDTAAINAAIAYAATLPRGGAVFFPVGTYAVTEINAALFDGGAFAKTLRLYGAGRNMSRIVPFTNGTVLLNLMGTNLAQIDSLHFDSAGFTPQCAIFMARTTVSTNCNNNRFSNIFTTGSYSKAAVVCNGSESSEWISCSFINDSVAASHVCFWTGGGSQVGPLQNITTVNGGTVSNVSNPNTDNFMFGVEFYAPFDNANLVRITESAGYGFFGCTLISGTSDNCKLVRYDTPTGGRINCQSVWTDCHFEVFGTGNTVHYLDGGSLGATIFDGISSYGGKYVVSTGTSVIDYNRTGSAAVQPILWGSTWTTMYATPNLPALNAHVYGMFQCNFAMKPSDTAGSLYVSGYLDKTSIDVVSYYGSLTRFVSCAYTTVAAALPTSGTFTVGQTIQRETPVVGQPIGWKCTVSGTLGTLNSGATTASTTAGSNVITVSTATGLAEGQIIAVAGSGGPYYVRKLVGTTVYTDTNAVNTVAGAATSFSAATLTAMANL